MPPVDVDQSKVVAAPPGADEAIRILDERYGVENPTPVYWYGGAALDCWDGLGFTYGGKCVFDAAGSNGVIIAWPGGDVRVSSTALAHGKAHERWDDGGHSLRQGRCDHPIWGPDPNQDYEPGTIVGDASAALVANGL